MTQMTQSDRQETHIDTESSRERSARLITRVPHRYRNTHSVSKTGNMGTGTVLDFGTLCTPHTHTAVSRVFTG